MLIRSRLYLKVLGNFGFLLVILVAMTVLVTNIRRSGTPESIPESVPASGAEPAPELDPEQASHPTIASVSASRDAPT